MPSKSPLAPLSDIKRNIELARSFLGNLSFEAFCQDQRTFYAVVRSLEIITEASRKLPDEIKARHPHIAWIEMARAGNFYRHHYERVLEQFIWDTVHGSLAPLPVVVEEELARSTES
jgi:uncharacterized protein with HEPN domain